MAFTFALPWWKKLLDRGGRGRKPNRKARPRPSFVPRLEVLEGRLAPAVFTVNTALDETTPDNFLSLRGLSPAEVQQTAGAVGVNDTIEFDPSLNGQTITLTMGELVIGSNLTIIGLGASSLTISGNNANTVFQIGFQSLFSSSAPTVSISGLTIADAQASGPDGGGIENLGTLTVANCIFAKNTASGGGGGGIANEVNSTLSVSDCTFAGNSAFVGGGIANSGNAGVTNCTFTGNSAGQAGGAVLNSSALQTTKQIATATVANCTFAGNSAGTGGAIDNDQDGMLTVINCTLADNSATGSASAGPSSGGGGIANSSSSTLTLGNTIIAGNTTSSSGADVSGNGISQGYNLIGNTSGASGFVATDLLGANPLLGPLQDNGGPTQTMALLPGSPAIDAGSVGLAVGPGGIPLSADQRGFARVANGNVDIGAFEVQFYLVYSTADSGGGTLRSAITNADRAGGSVVAFTTNGIIELASALPDITRSVQVLGPGANTLTVQRSTVPGTPAFRIFTVDAATPAIPDVTVTLWGLTIANGQASSGGGILNNAALTLSNSTVSGNSANLGGGIDNGGALTLTNSTVAGNSGQEGGAIFNFGPLTLTDCTLSGNSTSDFGAGIFNNSGTLTLTNSTLAGNSAANGGGGIFNSIGTLTLGNTIIAQNTASTGPDVDGSVTSLGYNLIGNGTGGSGFVLTDLVDINPVLAPLGNYGGPTQTMALLPGSPAIAAGNPALAVDASGRPLAADQRGVARLSNGIVDIGAFESRGFTLSVAGGNNQQAIVNMAFAAPLVVAVSSPFGDPVQEGVITFTAPTLGASATFPGGNTATINASGQASVTAAANSSAGFYAVLAAANGADTNFLLTNLSAITISPGALPQGTAGAAYSQALTAGGGPAGRTPSRSPRERCQWAWSSRAAAP